MAQYPRERVEAAVRGRWGDTSHEARFRDNVDRSGGLFDCWPWTGDHTSSGYGTFQVNRQRFIASRVAVELDGREIPPGMSVLHHCDNPPCVNPAHLFIGTQADNLRDMARKGRHGSRTHPERVPRGESVGTARLTVEQVQAIRASTESGPVLAARFGVGRGRINAIKRGESWRWLLAVRA